MRVVAVGGGGGGTNGHQPGGGGYVSCGIFEFAADDTIQVIVGTGGSGAVDSYGSNYVYGRTDGLASTFGTLVTAQGGKGCTQFNEKGELVGDGNIGCPGGSGSGANCWGNCKNGYTGKGGSGGSDGGISSANKPGGTGQGKKTYFKCLNLAVHRKLTAGDGGKGQEVHDQEPWGPWGASGGGGGVLVDGSGPDVPAGNGTHLCSLISFYSYKIHPINSFNSNSLLPVTRIAQEKRMLHISATEDKDMAREAVAAAMPGDATTRCGFATLAEKEPMVLCTSNGIDHSTVVKASSLPSTTNN